jgi:hypothetical protein
VELLQWSGDWEVGRLSNVLWVFIPELSREEWGDAAVCESVGRMQPMRMMSGGRGALWDS